MECIRTRCYGSPKVNVSELAESDPRFDEDERDNEGVIYDEIVSDVLRQLIKQHNVKHVIDIEQSKKPMPVDQYLARL